MLAVKGTIQGNTVVIKDEDIKKPNLEQYPDYTVFKQDYLVTTY